MGGISKLKFEKEWGQNGFERGGVKKYSSDSSLK